MSTTSQLTDKLDDVNTIKASIYSAILDKGGTFASGTDLSDYPAAIRTIGIEPNWIVAAKQSSSSNPYTFKESDLHDMVTLSGVSSGLRNMFFGKYFTSDCLKITEPFAVTQTECWQEAFMNSHGLGKVDLSGLTAITGSNAFVNAFRGNTNITEVDMSGLTSVSYYGMYYAFYGCSNLAKVDLSSTTYNTQSDSWASTFNGCYNLTEMTVNPDALRNSSSYSNPCGSATSLTTLRFSQNAVRNVYINWQTRLTKDSITGILQHLGTPVDSNQSCNFASYSYEEDLDSELAVAYFEAIEKGWTINGLEVTVKDIEIITPETLALELTQPQTITFRAFNAWTASVNDPNITLSAYSGQPGDSISITVTPPQGWTGNAKVTLSGLMQTVDIICYNTDMSDYLPLNYVETGKNTGITLDVPLSKKAAVQLKFMYLFRNGGMLFGYHPGVSDYTFRFFYYSNSLYFDYGSETGGGRLTSNALYSMNTVKNYEFGGHYVQDLDDPNKRVSGTYTGFLGTGGNNVEFGDKNGSDRGRFYGLKVYDNGKENGITSEFVPVQRISDSKYGILNKFSGTFCYANSGTVTGG